MERDWLSDLCIRPERNWNDPNGQITRVLARHGGVLDPRTLYYVNIGANDFNG